MPSILRDEDLIGFLGKQESQFLLKPNEIAEGVLGRLSGRGSYAGAKLPWAKVHDKIGFRPGELTVWAGVNGHGKSLLLSQAIAWWLPHHTILLASLEMPHEATLARMLRQVQGNPQVNRQRALEWLDWTVDRLWLYDQLDSVEADRILGLTYYGAKVLKVKHVVLDGLTKCGIAPDDYSKQKAFVDGLAWAVKGSQTHVHLVAHLRKGQTEHDRPDKWDIRGAGEISDIADNVLLLWRNKPKEAALERGDRRKQDEPDAILTIAKQRHGEWEGSINLHFHQGSQQFIGRSDLGAMPWPPQQEASSGV